jgi:hypothetical protein
MTIRLRPAALLVFGILLAGCQGGTNSTAGKPAAAGWARTVLPPSDSLLAAVAVDGAGSVYAAGQFWGPSTFDFGNGVTAAGSNDRYNALLLKYDSSDVVQWAQTVGTVADGAYFESVATDASGNVYAAGSLSGPAGSVDLGNGVTVTKSGGGSDSAVLVKYSASGQALWARAVGAGPGASYFASVALDASGNVYVAGNVEDVGTYGFGDGVTATGIASSDAAAQTASTAVLAKYDSSGTAQWARTATAGSPSSRFASVAIDSAGNAYAAGAIGGSSPYDFGDGVTVAGSTNRGELAGQVADNAVLVKYSASGITQWAQTPGGGSGGSGFAAAVVDSAGHVYAAGSLGGAWDTYDFGNGVTVPGPVDAGAGGLEGYGYAVLVRYDASGAAQWARSVGEESGANSAFWGIAVDSSGDVYTAGTVYTNGTYDFGQGASIKVDAQVNQVALVKYDSSGVTQWARSSQNGGSTGDTFTSVAVNGAQDLYVGGGVGGAGRLDFGNDVTVTSAVVSGWDALLVKYP